MSKTAYINARVEKKLKADAQKVFREVGVNTSDAVSMFLKQVILQDGLPFQVRVPNKESRRAIAEFKSGKKRKLYTGTTEEIFDAILKER